jgi:hypothetical protein
MRGMLYSSEDLHKHLGNNGEIYWLEFPDKYIKMKGFVFSIDEFYSISVCIETKNGVRHIGYLKGDNSFGGYTGVQGDKDRKPIYGLLLKFYGNGGMSGRGFDTNFMAHCYPKNNLISWVTLEDCIEPIKEYLQKRIDDLTIKGESC